VKLAPPEGTRYADALESATRTRVTSTLRALFSSWGYESVDVPVLERFDSTHPVAERSFKLTGPEGELLALRADYTFALAKLVHFNYPEGLPHPLRLQYSGGLWRTVVPDIATTREFTQLGLELLGASGPRADAELIHLAREAVRAVGLAPRVEVGNPGYVRQLFELADLTPRLHLLVADAIDRKDQATLTELLEPLGLAPDLKKALLGVADLYGDVRVLSRARQLAPWPETTAACDDLEAVLAEFEDSSELLLDLGEARRLAYYTGVTFRAYTFDFGQPLLGGGRYDGALLPLAAGFAIGLERLLSALPEVTGEVPPIAITLDDPPARRLRQSGYRVERALSEDVDELRTYARARGIPYLLLESGLEPLTQERPFFEQLCALLEAEHA
jgi:ATP phosphoribosyltransferase regulatory subunit